MPDVQPKLMFLALVEPCSEVDREERTFECDTVRLRRDGHRQIPLADYARTRANRLTCRRLVAHYRVTSSNGTQSDIVSVIIFGLAVTLAIFGKQHLKYGK